MLEERDKKVWWKCKKGHEWQASVGYRAKFARPCPICNGTHTLVTGVNESHDCKS